MYGLNRLDLLLTHKDRILLIDYCMRKLSQTYY